jgi:hypothetical protein
MIREQGGVTTVMGEREEKKLQAHHRQREGRREEENLKSMENQQKGMREGGRERRWGGPPFSLSLSFNSGGPSHPISLSGSQLFYS